MIMKRILLACFAAVLVTVSTGAVLAQERISGKVISVEDGTPLPGVNVVVKGTTNGTVTDVDGNYSLTAPSDGTLVFTFIGLATQEIAIGGRNTVDVQLAQDAQQLNEVVVTALGIERSKNELPYAAQEVRGDDVSKNRSTNFVTSLSGRVAGVDVKTNNNMGGSTNIVIRGYKSIMNNNQALFVIDGIPVSNANNNTVNQRNGAAGVDYGNAAADINPDNIESVNILKGAAASALYGSRAANGVVMITTKKGRKNSFDVVLNTGVTVGKIDKSTFARYQKEYGGGYRLTFQPNETYDDGSLPVPQFTADASYGPRFDNRLVYNWDAFDPRHPNYHKATEWKAAENGPETFYETAVQSNQSILVSGGNEKATFKVGYTRSDETGVLPNSTLDKNMFNFSTTYDFTQKLTVSASANFTNIKGVGRYGTGYSSANPNQVFRQWWATHVDMQEQKDAYFRNRQNITWNWNSARTGPIYMDNSYWTRYENFNNDSRDNYFGYIAANYKVNSWLEIMGRAAINKTVDLQEERVAVGSSAVARYERFDRTFSESNYDLMLSFKKAISDDISFNGVLGGNMRRSEMNSIRGLTSGGLAVPGLYALSNSRTPMSPPTEVNERIGVDGIFASANFGYKEMIFLDLAGRRDKSTTLPSNNNTFYYPSVAGNFVFSKLLDVSWLNHAKVRANYAQVGNDAPPLSVYNVYDKPTAIGAVPFFSLPNIKNNPDLKPERTNSIEIGVDADFFDERIGFDFTWYKSNTFDQILPVTVSASTGFTGKYVNAGEVQNKGIEVSAFVVPVRTSDFSWTMSLNYSRNRNEVISLYSEGGNPVLNVPISVNGVAFQGGVTLNAAVGHPYGVIRGTNYTYLNGQRVINAKGYYQPTASSAEIIGDPNPSWLGGVTNTLKYKNLSLSFLVDVRHGGDIFSLDMWYGDGSGLYEETAGLNDKGNPKRNPVAEGGGVLLPGVKADGTPNNVYAENFDGSGNTAYGYVANGQSGAPRAAYVYDASYVKLREMSITYSLPTTLLSGLKVIKAIDVSLVGRNLWIIHKNMKYSDPEESMSSGNTASGYQSGAYPTVRNYGFNVRFKF
jgi:TonB-linked SusC/RagA family outer membrane protein